MADTLAQPNIASGSGPYSTPRQLQLIGQLEDFAALSGKGVLAGGKVTGIGGLSVQVESASQFLYRGLVYTLPAAAGLIAASSQSLSRPDNALLSIGNQGMDLIARVYLASLPSSGNTMGLVGKWQSADLEYLLFVDNTGGTVRFKFQVRSTDNLTTTTVAASTFGTPSTATWYFLHAQHDAALDRIGISVNNGAHDYAATAGGVRDGTANFVLGSHTAGSYLDGRLDQVGLARGTLLTSADISTLYNAGSALSWGNLTSTLQAKFTSWWDLDERSKGAAAVTRKDAKSGNDLADNNLVQSADGPGIAVYNGIPDNASSTMWARLSRAAANQAILSDPDTYSLTFQSNTTDVAPDASYFRLAKVITASGAILSILNAVPDKYVRLADPLVQGKTTIGAGETAYVPAGESRLVTGPLVVAGTLQVDGRLVIL